MNLDFFLKDNDDLLPKKLDVETQIDEFLPPPPIKPYVPMKTGIDTMTQVEDHELFDFEREVRPMVHVITTKTLEQSLLELQEEDELEALELFKEEFKRRKESEGDRSARKVQEEMKKVQYKNEQVWSVKDLEKMKLETTYRVIGYSIGQAYLCPLLKNTLANLFDLGFFQDPFASSLSLDFIPWLVTEASANVRIKKEMGNKIKEEFNEMNLVNQFLSM